jgi:hypothetical protein
MKFPLVILLFLTFGCTTGVKMRQVNYGALFHDGNSKVWMLNKVMVGKKDFSPRYKNDKDILIFYENGRCCFQPLKSLGEQPGKKGEYSVFSAERSLTLYFKNEKWDFVLTTIEEDRIVMAPTKNSDLKYKLELIPLPEL